MKKGGHQRGHLLPGIVRGTAGRLGLLTLGPGRGGACREDSVAAACVPQRTLLLRGSSRGAGVLFFGCLEITVFK